jgi:hypothetical protein
VNNQSQPNWEWITKRLLVLATYGFVMEHYDKYLADPNFLTNEWLEDYHGYPLEDYLKRELAKTDLLLELEMNPT